MAIIRTLSRLSPKPITTIIVHEDKTVQRVNQSIKIGFPVLDGCQYERVEDIVNLEAKGNYTAIHLVDNRKLMISKNLQSIEKQLENNAHFIRIHRSHVVNMLFIKKYLNAGGGRLELENNTILPISNSRKAKFLESMHQFFC